MEQEILFFRTFVVKSRRDRYVNLLQTQKGKKKFLTYIDHFKDFDKNFVVQISGSNQNKVSLYNNLVNMGAPENCYIICDDLEYDQKTIPLKIALDSLFGSGMSYILICVAGKLGYYEGEDENFVLAAPR